MEQTQFKKYTSKTQGNYIFIEEYIVDIKTKSEKLIEMTEIAISNSRINSITNFRSDENNLERTAMSVISNNINAFTFQKYSEFIKYQETPVFDSEGNDTGETTIEQIIELWNNQFICDDVIGSFDDLLIPFYCQNTGFSLNRAFIPENIVIEPPVRE